MGESNANSKDRMIALLRQEFDGWEELLATLSEDQITARPGPSEMSVKDVIAHLWAWQQLSIARLEAAKYDTEPNFNLWPDDLEPESRDDIDKINAWVFSTYAGESWDTVHNRWQDGFQRLLKLSEEIPEDDMLAEDKYAWIEGHRLIRVIEGSYEHHHEHREDYQDSSSDGQANA